MRTKLILLIFFFSAFCYAEDTLNSSNLDVIKNGDSTFKKSLQQEISPNIYQTRLLLLDSRTPMDLSYNEKVQVYINNYLGKQKRLISRMLALKDLYFPIFEQQLDQYDLPLELKYLAIVESALNPRAKSPSGATGLWQFMYLTGKDFGLEVNSYLDDRQDPSKSTAAACQYFVKLYNIFGDWNLVLAAYNGGPGYIQRKINQIGSNDFWELYPHLRKETRNYVPTFIAVNYILNYSNEHEIAKDFLEITPFKNDTITIKTQASVEAISELLCINKETINYLNPSYKKELFAKNSLLRLPVFAVNDFLLNEEASYFFLNAVEKKEILINEQRVVYRVQKGDYLGSIAKFFGVKVFQLKEWNGLVNTELDVGDKLVVYVKNNVQEDAANEGLKKNEYIIQPGDTLWDIAKKHKVSSIWKIKSLNNLESDNLKPGTTIILPPT